MYDADHNDAGERVRDEHARELRANRLHERQREEVEGRIETEDGIRGTGRHPVEEHEKRLPERVRDQTEDHAPEDHAGDEDDLPRERVPSVHDRAEPEPEDERAGNGADREE